MPDWYEIPRWLPRTSSMKVVGSKCQLAKKRRTKSRFARKARRKNRQK